MIRIESTITKPDCLAQSDLKTFCELVLCGGEVQREGLEELVKKAKALVFLREDNEVFGVAGIKWPRNKHRNDVFRDARVPEYAYKFQLELGWIVVKPEYQKKGYSLVLSASAMSEAEGKPTFATTRLDNLPMQKTLERIGFRRYGDSWQGRNHRLVLYVKT